MAKSREGRKAFQALYPDEKRHKPMIRDLALMTKRRQFAGWVQDMWRLWKELSVEKTDMLVMLFPAFANRLTTSDGDTLLRSIDEQLRRYNDLLEKCLQQGIPVPASTGIAMNVQKLAKPVFDEEDTVPMRHDTSTDSSMNFLNAAFSFQDTQQ